MIRVEREVIQVEESETETARIARQMLEGIRNEKSAHTCLEINNM